eukprot:TRINITY_DN111366_c0_g1_i1.p2 TRINITY_DN111366_c0_g1~~TRINITY_DN111366_c0_g1_i1.p2  ORF type:complete len:204 (-),score=47.96 TRINITY_DN111366_c0_g1_i1:268-879(-)
MSRRSSLLSRTSSMTSQGKKDSAEEVTIDFLTGDFEDMKEKCGVVLLGDKRHGITSMECVQELIKRGTVAAEDLGVMFFEGAIQDKPPFGTGMFIEDDITMGKNSGMDLDQFVATRRCTAANPRWADKVTDALKASSSKIHILFCGADHLRVNLPRDTCASLQEELQKRGVSSVPYIFNSDHEELFEEEAGGAVILYNFTADL